MEIKKSRHAEEKVIATVKEMEAGRKAKEVAREQSDAVCLEVEIQRNGSERSQTAARSVAGERVAKEAGGGPVGGQRRAADGDPKKRVEFVEQRRDVAFVIVEHEMSERQACKLLEMDRTSYRYEPQPDPDEKLRQELVELARQKPRYGYRRLHAVFAQRGR